MNSVKNAASFDYFKVTERERQRKIQCERETEEEREIQ